MQHKPAFIHFTLKLYSNLSPTFGPHKCNVETWCVWCTHTGSGLNGDKGSTFGFSRKTWQINKKLQVHRLWSLGAFYPYVWFLRSGLANSLMWQKNMKCVAAYLSLYIFSLIPSLGPSQDCSPNDVSDLHFARPSRWCQLVCLLWQTVSHMFWGQNTQDIQHPRLLGAALLSADRSWLWRALLLLQHLRAVPCLMFNWCNHTGLVHGHGWDWGRAGTSWAQSCEDLCDLTWLCPPGFWCIWWHFGPVGFPHQTAAQVKLIIHIL